MKWENLKGKTITDIIYIKKEMSDMPYFYFDPTYILVLIGVVLSLIASAQVKSAYKKYEKVSTRSGFTAEQVAAIVPVVSIGSTLSWPLILIGLLIPRLDVCITLGILLFSLVVVFQFVTLPVEFNASGRAIAILRNGGFMTEEELGGAKRVLTAAALTYVAAMVTAILQLVRLLLLTNRRR